MFQDRAHQVQTKITQLINQYQTKTGQILPKIQVRFDLRGRSAGVAGQRGGQYYMRFNKDMMLNQGWDHLITDTVPHELAHIICFANGSDRGHGVFWKRTCIELGGNGERCHKEEVTYANGNTYVYTTSTGRTINLSVTKHRRIQQGQSYTGRNGLGRIDKSCSFSLLGQVTAPKEVPVQTQLPKPVTAQGSKADLIRARIKEVKALGLDARAVVNYAVIELGMTATLARTYTKNNWNKV